MRIIIEMEVPGDSRSLFRVILGEKVIGQSLTAVQSHILVGDILERIVLGRPKSTTPEANGKGRGA